MKLSEFIARDMNAILAAWDSFAGTLLPAAADMNAKALRDHAEEILRAVIEDIESAQTLEEQIKKSQGRAFRPLDAPRTAAETHAFLRERSGFDINQMASEYRALRASVLRLWTEACKPNSPNGDQMVRFNEAIDQALAESVAFFGNVMKEERNLLLGMLGHDMRNPLNVIQLSATHLTNLNVGDPVSAVATRISRSSAQLRSLLDDLIDFNRTNLGLGLHIAPVAVDLEQLLENVLEQLRASHPNRKIALQVSGNVKGVWDPHRIHQMIDNLVINALKHGAHDAPIEVMLVGQPTEVTFSVRNRGRAIEPATLKHLFEPLVRGTRDNEHGSLGLGLFIVRQIAVAHGGDINVHSDEAATVFTVRLPRLNHHS